MAGSRRALWISLGVVGATLGIVAWLVIGMLDPDALKPRLAAAVKQATGRTLTLSGPLGVKLAWRPTVTLDDVALSNPPGFSRPEMARIARVEVTLAFAPLFQRRVEIGHVVLVAPDILLETDRAGHGNWLFTPEKPVASPLPAPAPASGPAREGFALSVNDIRVENARIGWRDARSGRARTAEIPALRLAAPVAAPMTAAGTLVIEGRTVTLDARTGSLDHLRATGNAMGTATGTAGDWPVTVKLETGGATLAVEGHAARPLEGRGYAFVLDGTVPDPSVFASLLPRPPLALTSVKAITAHAEIRDSGTPVPTVDVLRLQVEAVHLDPPPSRTRLENITLSARGNEPLRFGAHLVTPRFGSEISGTAGSLAWLLSGASGPVTLDAAWRGAGAQISVKGQMRTPQRLTGFTFDVTGEVPDPALLLEKSPLALKSIAFQTKLTGASPGGSPGEPPVVSLFRVTSNMGDLAGELTVTLKPRLAVSGHVTSQRLDLDALRPPPEGTGTPPGSGVHGTGAGAVSPPAAARDKTAPVIPGTKPRFDLLRLADAHLTFKLGVLRTGGADITGIDAGVSLKDGALVLEPFTIAAPDQSLSGRLSVDAAKTPPALHLTLKAPGLALKPLLAMLHLPPAVTGAAEIRLDLTGAGETARAIAASLNGWAGVAVQNGKLDAGLVNQMLEHLRPLHIQGTDITDLRCFAVRADVKAGVATLRPMALNTAALIVDGGGEVDLGNETLNLRLRPRARIAGTGFSLPVRVSGPWRVPKAAADLSGTGALSGLLLGGKDIMGAAGGGDPCPVALARARDAVAPAEAPAPKPEPVVAPPPAPPKPETVTPPPPEPRASTAPESALPSIVPAGAASPPASAPSSIPGPPRSSPLPEEKK